MKPLAVVLDPDLDEFLAVRTLFRESGFDVEPAWDPVEAEMKIRENSHRMVIVLTPTRAVRRWGFGAIRTLRRVKTGLGVIIFGEDYVEMPGDQVWVLRERPPFFPGFWMVMRELSGRGNTEGDR